MVPILDRSTPAPRTSLTDRKPQVPSRTLKPELILNSVATSPNSARWIRYPWMHHVLPVQNLSPRSLRRAKSLSAIRKTVRTDITRSASLSIQSTGCFRSKADKIFSSEGVEGGRVARIAKMLDSAVSGSTASTVRSVDKQKDFSVNVNLVAQHDFSSIIERPGSSSISSAANKSHGNISTIVDPELVPRKGLWNSGYIGLEAYSRMVELLQSGVSSNNG